MPSAPTVTHKFLIIDDQADYRSLLAHHLTTRWPGATIREYDPQLAGRLPDAFAGAGNDLVLLGNPCQGGDALDWLRQFRAQPRFPPVVLVGSGEERQIVAAIRAGAADYVGKPGLSHRRLIEAVEGALATGQQPPRTARFPGPGEASGQIVASLRNYELIRPLADGEIAAVYLVRERPSGQEMVLKVLRQLPELGDERLLDRFLREAELIAGIRHTNIVQIHDFGVADDHAFIAMEYCGGGSLKRRITAGMDPFEAYRLMREIAGALGALHEAGILHRDLKPTNVLFREDGTAVLIDFGLAKQVHLEAELTGTGAIFGTPYYMSPEQGHGEPVDQRSDIYSLGVILYEMLVGLKPFDGDTAMGVIIQHRQAPVPALPRELKEFQPLVHRMLAKRPEDRFGSVAELLAWEPGLVWATS